ncbi:MAG: peptidylprolyl isomerase [Bacteroidota bacterium]|jgi:peptidyl-prolyl cis-trans isomerase SurA
MKNIYILITLLLVFKIDLKAQTSIDGVIAVVGENIILRSDLEVEYQQLKDNFIGIKKDSALCVILNKILTEKLMLHKAQTDSITLPDERVEAELDKRIRFYLQKFGNEKTMEEYLGKSIPQLKMEYRDKVKNQMKVQEIQQTIIRDVKVSPTDVQHFFATLPKDSLPNYSAEVEVSTIIRLPKVTTDEEVYALQTINELRERIVSKEKSFESMAILYSQDPGSSVKGGELGYFGRNEMVPEFEAMAFKLKPDSVSRVIKSKYGYHILKLIDRKGERINVRHILIKPQTVSEDLELAYKYIDSLRNYITKDSMSFEYAAKKYNDDEDAMKANGGFFTDPVTGSTKVPMEELEKDIYFAIEKLKPHQISEPFLYTTAERTQGYKMVYLKSYSPPHVANLKDDYQKIQQAATENKKQQALDKWIESYKKESYIRISEEWKSCNMLSKWYK